MKVVSASAPGKIILFGEHAVVYGQPALAVPIRHVQATAAVEPSEDEACWIDARTLHRRYRLQDAGPDDLLAAAVRQTRQHVGAKWMQRGQRPGLTPFVVTVDSTIPMASGLGSGAAVSAASVRALSTFFGETLTDEEVSALVFETEKLLHGTPSGIDNTVIAYGQPVYFVKGQRPEPFTVAWPFPLLIADTGRPSPTKTTVGDVRAAWQQAPERYEPIFRAMGDIAREARVLIETPKFSETFEVLGELMNRNHQLLRELNVSSPELETLLEAARASGALGAKLSGGGRGGNLIALPALGKEERVRAALEKAGAKRVITTVIGHQ
jgi:mevalonate kinase